MRDHKDRDTEAEYVLPVLPKKLLAEFRATVRKLNRLLEKAEEYVEDPGYYLDGSDSLHLMDGPSHTKDGSPRYYAIIDSVGLTASGGDW